MTERRRNAAEWADLTRRFSSSGKSVETFAAAEGLNSRYFARKLKRLTKVHKPSGFVRVTPGVSSTPVVVQLGDVRIHCTEAVSPQWLAAVASALRA
ncbi:MAG: hypothetical protein R3E84_23455 [Pseudomonadales bacterium]